MLEDNSPGAAVSILMRDVADMVNGKSPKSPLKVSGYALREARNAEERGGRDSM